MLNICIPRIASLIWYIIVVPDFALPHSTMGLKLLAQTVRWSMEQQWSALTLEESESMPIRFHPFSRHAQYLRPNTPTLIQPRRLRQRECYFYLAQERSLKYLRTTTQVVPVPTCTGTNYTVTSSDTCQSISTANSIAIDRLISANGLDYNCTSLEAGMQLCLGASCALQTVQANQSCTDIIGTQKFNYVQLISWNPIIHSNCDNLDSLVGRSICIS